MNPSDNIIIFDLETQRSLAEVGGERARLGLSIGVTYHVGERRFDSFDEATVADLVERLHQADLVVGYNIRRFDLPVLSAYTDRALDRLPICDMLEQIEQMLGYRLKLDSLARHTLGLGKSADGFLALQWWREGRIELIRDYCQQDVDVTRRLWEFGRANGFLYYWDHHRRQRARVPVSW